MSSSNIIPVSGYWRLHKKFKYWSLHCCKTGFVQSSQKATCIDPDPKILYLPHCLKGRGRESSSLEADCWFLHPSLSSRMSTGGYQYIADVEDKATPTTPSQSIFCYSTNGMQVQIMFSLGLKNKRVAQPMFNFCTYFYPS